MAYRVGVDIGSTTIKVIVLDNEGYIVFKTYERHYSQIPEKIKELLATIETFVGDEDVKFAISGSAGMGLAKKTNIAFVQEVFALREAVSELEADTDVVIELGGEDAKILFLTGGMEERMNGTCAGGTGAFIDQMATLLNVSVEDLDALSLKYETLYPIASRCGVFAKTDIQPLINQGANKADIAASIFQAVVEQTITGLAQGRKIKGKVLFLGGPLCFNVGLRNRFVDTLKLTPENTIIHPLGQYFVAMGAAIYADGTKEVYKMKDLQKLSEKSELSSKLTEILEPLFADKTEYSLFKDRHDSHTVGVANLEEYQGNAYLGVDVGSTTSKVALISENGNLLYTFYASNQGSPLEVVREQLVKIYEVCGDKIHIAGSAVTGYGEELIKTAFHFDYGVVETVAHFTAAKFFNPKVDYIIDIGGQDMKCFKIHNQTIDSIILNEACSSGCGSFVQSFAEAMGYDLPEFTKLGIWAKNPVDLGSRCTVFMNSSVKQAQRDGATIGDISAGLAISVIKNAIYKVLRIHDASELGDNIVVQGGTFLNDAILRSFEKEIGKEVIRPNIAGLMGAFGAALYAKDMQKVKSASDSSILPLDAVETFKNVTKVIYCNRCTNHCALTVNKFANGETCISGNKCERGQGFAANNLPNVYEYTLDTIRNIMQEAKDTYDPKKTTIGLPLVLNMFENLAFWYGFFKHLGFNVKFSDESSKKLYSDGQFSIPSDTVCFPAKLVHGHIENLIAKGVDAVFYPCSSYNFNEGGGDNNYNCPVVAYYPEVIHANVESINNVKFYYPYLSLADSTLFISKFHNALGKELKVTLAEVALATHEGKKAYDNWKKDISDFGHEALTFARENGKQILVLAGRPYHLDRQVNHSIDKMLSALDFVVVSERTVTDLVYTQKVNVLNQWTYHTRMYDAARYVCRHEDMQLVQLVSFGCGLDAITSDELKDILERNGKIYTQLKIDEIDNLAAVKIRARSLKAAIESRQ